MNKKQNTEKKRSDRKCKNNTKYMYRSVDDDDAERDQRDEGLLQEFDGCCEEMKKLLGHSLSRFKTSIAFMRLQSC